MGHAILWFWNEYLYAPLFNALIWLYNGPAEQNLALAVIIMTVILRLVLLPFTILSERSKHIYALVEEEIVRIELAHKNDPELQKERIRELLRDKHVSPWSRVASLGLQALVLVVLYQVFMSGIRQNNFDVLYPSVARPDIVFTSFFSWNLAAHSLFWACLVGAWIFIEISIDQKKHRETLTKTDIFYRLAFPAFTVAALYILPMVKSLFILTSLTFTLIISSIRQILFKPKKAR